MTYISHRTPTNYRNRHSDWYNGWFASVCDAFGKVGEYLFYMDCENKASVAKNLCSMIPIVGGAVGDFFVAVFRAVYEKRYIDAYDNYALQACKIFEKFEGQIKKTYADFENAVANAKTYIQNNLINPIKAEIDNNIKPKLTKAMNDLYQFNVKFAGLETDVTNFRASIAEFETKLKSFYNGLYNLGLKLQNIDEKANVLNTQITDLFGKFDALDQRVKALELEKGKIPFPILEREVISR